jgi:hypothetical protein
MSRSKGIFTLTSNYEVTIQKPMDARMIVETYSDLTTESNWKTSDGRLIAYNGMITAVWLDKDADDNITDKNGIYFFFDPTVKDLWEDEPDVTKEENWHRLGSIDSLPGLAEQITTLQDGLRELQADVGELQSSATEVVESLPEIGKPNKLYVVAEEATTYVWHNGKYILVGDGADDEDIQIINGGKAI